MLWASLDEGESHCLLSLQSEDCRAFAISIICQRGSVGNTSFSYQYYSCSTPHYARASVPLSRPSDLSPPDQTPVLVNTSTQRNLLSNFSACRLCQGNLCQILSSVRSWIQYTALTLRTLPPVEVDPMLTIKTSCFASFETFVCFLSSPIALTPSNLSSAKSY